MQEIVISLVAAMASDARINYGLTDILLNYNWINAMSLKVIQQAVSGIAQSRVFRVSITNVPAVVHRWIAANPGQSALLIANGILIFTPTALTGPLLATMGFGVSGPVAGSVAAWLQSILGNVGAHSVFAYLQSAAMGGYGVATVNGVVQAWGMISGAAVMMCSGLGGRSAPMSGCSKNLDRQRANTRTSESTMPAPSSTVLNTSDQTYQVVLTTEPLDTADVVDVPTDLSTPFDCLTNSDTNAGQR